MAGNSREELYFEKEKLYLERYRNGSWGEDSALSPFDTDATNVFYRVLAEQGKRGSKVKIAASPRDLRALAMKNFAPSPVGVMAVKDFRLSILFHDAEEFDSQNGQAVIQIAKEWAGKAQEFRENLRIKIMRDEDKATLQAQNIQAFTVASTSPDLNGYAHAYKVELTGGDTVGHFYSLEQSGELSAAKLNADFETLFARATPVTLDHG